MANRIVLFSERIAQTTVNDVEHTESQSVNSTAVVKYFFQPEVDPDLSFAQITAVSQTQLFYSPPGTAPPFVLAYNASSVPILQLALSSDSLPESKLYDLGNTILRTQLATIAGASVPFPYGGKQRQVQVDLDPPQLRANGLSANDVVNAIGEQNLILPAGTQKIDSFEYFIKLNASPTQLDDLNNMPVRAQNGTVTYVRDVAHVRDGYAPQTNMVRVDGRRSVLMNVLKTGNASTIDIIDGVKHKLPQIRASLPAGTQDCRDQRSVCVRARSHQWSDPRSRDRCRVDRIAHLVVSGQLAQHLDHHDLHSAVDSRLHCLSFRHRSDDQYHDVGWFGACRRYSGG